MTTDRIKEIQSKTAYPDSISVQQALLQVWNECEQEQLRIHNAIQQREQLVCPHCKGLEVYIDEYGGNPCKCTKQAN